MAEIKSLFVTKLYQARLADAALLADLKRACLFIADEDAAGKEWSRDKGYKGFTSYASLNDLPKRDPAFGALKKHLDSHAAKFAEALYFDLGGRKLRLDSLWVNVLGPGGAHTGHIHPHSALSGTFYVDVPKNASSLKIEDPRLPMMMAAPARHADAPEEEQRFVYVAPQAGDVLMWESFVRHEVTPNQARSPRISISFNYAL